MDFTIKRFESHEKAIMVIIIQEIAFYAIRDIAEKILNLGRKVN